MKLTIHLTPKASHNIIEGWSEDTKGQKVLRVKVRAVPENGKANQALIRILSQQFHIPQTRIVLLRGTTARIKQLEISGTEEELNRISKYSPPHDENK